MAQNGSTELCLKLTYLLIVDHVLVDTSGGASFGPRGII